LHKRAQNQKGNEQVLRRPQVICAHLPKGAVSKGRGQLRGDKAIKKRIGG